MPLRRTCPGGKSHTYRVGNKLSRPARNCTLLYDNGTLAGILSHDSRHSFKGSHVRRASRTGAAVLSGGVDSDKDNIGFADACGNVRGEE